MASSKEFVENAAERLRSFRIARCPGNMGGIAMENGLFFRGGYRRTGPH